MSSTLTCDATDAIIRKSVCMATFQVQVLHAHGKVHLGDIPCAKENKSDEEGKRKN
jgi:hypothetical protein